MVVLTLRGEYYESDRHPKFGKFAFGHSNATLCSPLLSVSGANARGTRSMQSTYRKVVRGASVHKTVLLYVTNKDEQLVDKARQLGVEAVALPSAKKLIACTEEFWLVGKLCQL